MDSFLPARFSMSPFFVRHTCRNVAKPRRMVHIEGLNGAPICSVNDAGFPSMKGGYENTFPPNNYMEQVLSKGDNFNQYFAKKERVAVPQGRFQTYGLINDTQKWKEELDKLASSVGLVTHKDIENAKKLREVKAKTPDAGSNLNRTASPDKKYTGPPRTARLNEPLNTGRKFSRGTPTSRALSLVSGKPNFLVDDRDREVWMLQCLCQILQTDNLSDVQSWLVSSDANAKDKVKQLLDNAMKGFEESGRIQALSDSKHQTPLPESNEEKKSSNIQLDNLKGTIERIRQETPVLKEIARKEAHPVNILKLDDDEKQQAPVSPVFNINIIPKTANQKREEPANDAVIKIEAPVKDMKIEEVKLTMFVKDDKTNTIQSIQGNWKPAESVV